MGFKNNWSGTHLQQESQHNIKVTIETSHIEELEQRVTKRGAEKR